MRSLTWSLGILILVLFLASPVLAVSGPVIYQGKYYYKVNSADPTEDTGAEVCAKAGTPYVGFTALTTDVCKLFHPSATVTSGVDGSRSGFYCNGPPQTGKCAKETNTCDICPACNLNVDSTTVISDQYNEMYVECGAPAVAGQAEPDPNFKPDLLGSLNAGIRGSLLGLSWNVFDKEALKKYADNRYACEFYQAPLANKFYFYCAAPFAKENFCKKVMGSLSAQAEFCGTDKDGLLNGLIVCSMPCPGSGGLGVSSGMPAKCAFDVDRMRIRGSDAPISFCSQQTTLPQASPGVTLMRPTLGTGQLVPAGTGTTTTGSGTTLCPSACYLRTVSLGAAGNGYVNCEISPNSVHKPQNTCSGTETQLSIEKNQVPVPCTCPPVETVSTACPSQCETGSSICFGDPRFIGKSGIPCDGTVQGTVNMHCTCVLRDGQWKLGSQYQIY